MLTVGIAAVAWLPTSVLSAAGIRSTLVTVSSADPFASTSCISANLGTNYPGTSVEPSIAASPAASGQGHLLIGAWQQDRWDTGGARGIVAGYSRDNGRTWSTAPLPFSACAPSGLPYERATDPWVSFGADGTAYVAAIPFHSFQVPGGIGSAAPGVAVVTSRNGGQTWTPPQIVGSGGADKDSITADPYQPGTAYLIWDGVAGGQGGQVVAKTTDAGRTWQSPVLAVRWTDRSSLGSVILVAPGNRRLYDIYELLRNRGDPNAPQPKADGWIALSTSTDGGASWSEPRTIARERPMGALHSAGQWVPPVRTSAGMPSAAIDAETGAVYVAWEDARFTRGARSQIVLVSSKDGGAHWSKPALINPHDRGREFTPSITVNPKGVVAIGYYSMINRSGNQKPLPAKYMLQMSTDHGQHFGSPVKLAGPFDMRNAPPTAGDFVGDYTGLTAAGNTFVALFPVPGPDGTVMDSARITGTGG